MAYQPRHAAPRPHVQRARRVAGAVATTAATAVAATGVAGTAYALWTAGGSGSITAAAATSQDLRAAPATVPGGSLYPGATADATVTVTNPNPYAVTVTSITGGPVTSDKGAACDAATGVAFAPQTGSFTVPAGSSKTFTLPGALSMSNASDTSCQGAVFTVPVSLVGQSG